MTDNELDLEISHDGDVTVIRVLGEVDFTSAPMLDEAMTKARGATEGIVVDLTQVGFIDSSGLRVLATQQADGGLGIAVACQALHRRLFEITQLHEVMPVCDSVDDAVSALRGAH